MSFIKLPRHVNHGEKMTSIDFEGHRSKVKVTMGIIDKCGAGGDAMLWVVIFSFALAPLSCSDGEGSKKFITKICLQRKPTYGTP